MISVTLSSFGNRTGYLQPSLKYDLHNLPPTRNTPSSSKKRSNWKIFEFLFSILSSSLSHGVKNLISAANSLACTRFMISISASLSKLLLIISPWLSPFRIFFKSFLYLSTIEATLFILNQEDILLSRASRMSFPVEMQLVTFKTLDHNAIEGISLFLDHSVKSFRCCLEWSTLLLVFTEKMVLGTIFEQPGQMPHQYL